MVRLKKIQKLSIKTDSFKAGITIVRNQTSQIILFIIQIINTEIPVRWDRGLHSPLSYYVRVNNRIEY